MSRCARLARCSLLALCLLAGRTALAFEPRPVPGRLLLKLHDGVPVERFVAKPGSGVPITGQSSLDALNAAWGARSFAAQFPGETSASKATAGADMTRFFVVDFPSAASLETLRAAYAADPAVEIAEFDWMCPVSVETDDSASQWYLQSSTGADAHVTGGWNHSTGSASVLLGIADSGVDWQHPDLGGSGPSYTNGNIWINTAELNGAASVDDDGNGYVDDVRGYDFVSSLSGAWPGEDAIGADNDPRDFNGHGTHVAGIASASTNNGIGVAGVGYNCKVMALRIGGSIDDAGTEQGVVLMSAAASAISYARVKGAAAFNCSWGSSNVSSLATAVNQAIAAGMVICVAAGNDNNQNASYLSSRGDCFDVAATDASDHKAGFSSYGTWVDVSAPGVAILSTYFDHAAAGSAQHTYTGLQGTSMATPVVTGLVGLVKANNMALTGSTIKLLIQQGCDNLDTLNPAYAGKLGSGRVNALRTFKDFFLSVPADYPDFAKALAASGPGDTLAFRGGVVHTSTWYVNRRQRLLQGGWNAAFTVRDPLGNPTVIQPLTGPGVWFPILSGVDNTLVLDGIRVTGGHATSISTPLVGSFGGGLLCIDASPVLRNCVFESSLAGDVSTFGGGGAAFFSGSAAQVENCTFRDASAQQGAGVYVYGSTVHFEDCTIANNTAFDAAAPTFGAGLLVDGGNVTATDLVCTTNTGADEGGGVYVKAGVLTLTRALLQQNTAVNQGGNARVPAGGTLVLRGSEVRGGQAQFGGGMVLTGGGVLDLASCVVAGNVAGIIGGGIYATGSTASVVNATFDRNSASLAGADAIYASGCPSPWTLRSSLLSNHAATANPACVFTGAAPALDWNAFWSNAGGNISGGSLGANDATFDPLYVNAAAGDVALGLHSPALDSGDPALLDVDGGRSDRGAFGGPQSATRAPAFPTGLAAVRLMGPTRNQLTWTASPAPDVTSYAVYRSASSSFVPSAATYIGSTATPSYTDMAGSASDYYRIAALDASAASSGWSAAVSPTPTDVQQVPARFALHANAPNPFNPATVVPFDLHEAADVVLDVYDARGRLVRTLVRQRLAAGVHRTTWDGRDAAGTDLPSGVYVAHLVAGTQRATHKMILVR